MSSRSSPATAGDMATTSAPCTRSPIAFRSGRPTAVKVEVDLEGNLNFNGNDPRSGPACFSTALPIPRSTLPAQFVAGVATKVTDDLIVEVGVRWEDWDSQRPTDSRPAAARSSDQPSVAIDRDWHSTWTYNIGANYRLNETVAINAGYLYGENPMPNSTFEPIIPDTDAHLFTIGTDLTFGQWMVSGGLRLRVS